MERKKRYIKKKRYRKYRRWKNENTGKNENIIGDEKMDIMSFARVIYGNRKRNNVMMIIAITMMAVIINIYHILDKKK